MRSHNFARAVLRVAARNGSVSQSPIARSTSLNVLRHTSLSYPPCIATSVAAARAFSTTRIDLKKKVKKNAFAAIEDDTDALDDDAFAVEEDDLFGSVSDSTSTSATSSTSSSSSSNSQMSRVEFTSALEQFTASLSYDLLDRGHFPALRTWRRLALQASTAEDFESLLEAAKLYRERVGSLGSESALRFAAQAVKLRLPELAVVAFGDRYTYGLEYDLGALWVVQSGLARKLGRGREEVLASAQMDGAPVVEVDLLGVLAESTPVEAGEGKAEGIKRKHELDMPLARAQLSIIDRMTLLTSLSTTLAGKTPDTVLLTYLIRAYVDTFHLTTRRSATNPLLMKVLERSDGLIGLLTRVADGSKVSAEAPRGVHLAESLQRNLVSVLGYVAARGQDGFKKDGLDPVKTLYGFMDRVDREASSKLVWRVEPLLQSQGSVSL
ncbi:hypothetical protein PSEUBRA_004273 [Kalmanozyma brasiliensis GHG001]|uniref:Uncharacterized protein n=1 Tax=Kalmanozyma brasiliensis (strain GHG001) TaxID=1365824 RepID=V5EVT2_KALBG|nr:uncharacterized protein PSEUBRA_004273 [Kalmanozyma brasiliensis GHG001]EST06379.1 hypothetical protein PSEUBRA_004273 [Kalmanozyma brasiliensis GHG001]